MIQQQTHEDTEEDPGATVRTHMPSPSNLNKKDQVSKPHQPEQLEENKVSLMECESLSLSQILTDRKKEICRQVKEEEARSFARKENLLFLGETSCYNSINNCQEIFKALIERVHQTQTDLVRQGIKTLDDLRFGEEERKIRYDRCCY